MSELPPTLSEPAVEGDTALEGTTLGAYRIEKLLGEGAMGQVFLAIHVALGRPVALKTLKPAIAADRALTERFFAEARAVNIIRHENIVECTDLVNDPGGRSYIVMELLEGGTLGAAIREAGRLPAKRAAKIAAQIAEAIGAAHGKGIVHRDLKPENVYLIKRAGSRDYVKVLDFGIARLRPEYGGVSATQSGAVIGTPAYMSPEQVRGEKVGPAADIYALGVIVFQMLTGRLPFEASSMSMMLVAQLQETAPRVDKLAADVPRALASLVESALAKEASGRPADMSAFRRALLEAVDLPVETNASLVDSSSSLSKALAATLPPTGAGQSSISGAAGELARKPPRAAFFAGGAIAIAAGAVLLVTRPWASAPSEKPVPANQTTTPVATPAPAPPVSTPAPVVAPAAVVTPAPAPVALPPRDLAHGAELKAKAPTATPTAVAHAEPLDAEQAFNRGRELMKAGKFTEACAEFDKSEQLDPAAGTLLNLAQCDEKLGKLAAAIALYRKVVADPSNGARKSFALDLEQRAEKRLADEVAAKARETTEPAKQDPPKEDPPKDPKVDRSKQLVGPKVGP